MISVDSKLKLAGVAVLLAIVLSFFYFVGLGVKKKTPNIEKSFKKQNPELNYSVLLPEFSVSINSIEKRHTLKGIKFSKASITILASNKTYSYFIGNSPEVLLKKELIIIRKPKGLLCNENATIEASGMVIDTKLRKVRVSRLKVKKGERLIIGTTKERGIEFEKICSFIEGRRKSPF